LAAEQPGYLGGGVIAAGRPEGEWHIIYRFADEESARSWEGSFTWSHWGANSASFTPEAAVGARGVQDWFEGPVRMLPPPAKWKLWFVNTGAVFPPVLIFNLFVIPYLAGVNLLVRTLALCVGVSAVVTWLVMPRLQRMFKKWLYPSVQSLGQRKRPMENGMPPLDVRFKRFNSFFGDT
jgi:antibiotic biosynthesis monooxygenase (ABM) superfamily enzyme